MHSAGHDAAASSAQSLSPLSGFYNKRFFCLIRKAKEFGANFHAALAPYALFSINSQVFTHSMLPIGPIKKSYAARILLNFC